MLDPIITMCKLALLYFMPEGTKISLGERNIILQETGYMQTIERFKNGDMRWDIARLYEPIYLFVQEFLAKDKSGRLAEDLQILSQLSIKGLFKLQKTYHDDRSISIIIQYLINLIKNGLQGNLQEDILIPMDKVSGISPNLQIVHPIVTLLQSIQNMEESPKDILAIVHCCEQILANREV
jgi:hypothetical protein